MSGKWLYSAADEQIFYPQNEALEKGAMGGRAGMQKGLRERFIQRGSCFPLKGFCDFSLFSRFNASLSRLVFGRLFRLVTAGACDFCTLRFGSGEFPVFGKPAYPFFS